MSIAKSTAVIVINNSYKRFGETGVVAKVRDGKEFPYRVNFDSGDHGYYDEASLAVVVSKHEFDVLHHTSTAVEAKATAIGASRDVARFGVQRPDGVERIEILN